MAFPQSSLDLIFSRQRARVRQLLKERMAAHRRKLRQEADLRPMEFVRRGTYGGLPGSENAQRWK